MTGTHCRTSLILVFLHRLISRVPHQAHRSALQDLVSWDACPSDRGSLALQARCSLRSAELQSQSHMTSARTGSCMRRSPCRRRSSGPPRWCVQSNYVDSLGPVALGLAGVHSAVACIDLRAGSAVPPVCKPVGLESDSVASGSVHVCRSRRPHHGQQFGRSSLLQPGADGSLGHAAGSQSGDSAPRPCPLTSSTLSPCAAAAAAAAAAGPQPPYGPLPEHHPAHASAAHQTILPVISGLSNTLARQSLQPHNPWCCHDSLGPTDHPPPPPTLNPEPQTLNPPPNYVQVDPLLLCVCMDNGAPMAGSRMTPEQHTAELGLKGRLVEGQDLYRAVLVRIWVLGSQTSGIA